MVSYGASVSGLENYFLKDLDSLVRERITQSIKGISFESMFLEKERGGLGVISIAKYYYSMNVADNFSIFNSSNLLARNSAMITLSNSKIILKNNIFYSKSKNNILMSPNSGTMCTGASVWTQNLMKSLKEFDASFSIKYKEMFNFYNPKEILFFPVPARTTK